MWTSKEKDEIWNKWREDDHLDDIVRSERLASFAVELVAERGGTMTAEEVADRERASKLSAIDMENVFEHITAQGATVATLQAKLDACEAALQDAQTDGAMWEAEAQRIRGEVTTLQAKVAELEKEANHHADARLAAEVERDALRAEVERLKADIGENGRALLNWKRRAEIAESHLAAIRGPLERAEAARRALQEWDQQEPTDAGLKAEAVHAMQNLGVALADAYRVLEGDAPNSPEIPDGSGAAPAMRPIAKQATKCSGTPPECGPGCMTHGVRSDAPQEAKTCAWGGGECGNAAPAPCGFCNFHCGHARGICAGFGKRYPCSPTCTHDDAAKPGHPERVKEKSEAFSEAVEAAENLAAGERGLQRAYDNGAEAMRAACWEAIQPLLQRLGFVVAGAPTAMGNEFKAAIEGAAP